MQPCPRQSEGTLSSQYSHDSHWREDGTCSYCGSISADELFKAIERGDEIGPTDKNYKIYIKLPEPYPEELRVVSAITFKPEPSRISKENWIPINQVDPAMLKRDGWGTEGYTFVQTSQRGPFKHGKFYFQHLTPDERVKFVELLNQKKINIGYPGYFYQLPFFAVRK